jgi:asparagine synthase (glutamine-hydrolysing)
MINCDDCWALSELPEDQGYPYDDLDMSNCDRSMLLKLMSAASNDKCRVILGGHWGDQVTGQPAYGNPHCIRDVPFSKLSGELPIFIQKYHYPTWHFFLRAIMPALIPANLYSELTRKRRNIHVSKSIQTAAQDYLHPPRFRFASALQIYRSVSSGIVSARLAAYDRISAHTGVEWRFPFLDRRLIDFMLNVPGHMVFRGGVNRYTHRQAMQGVLPVEIRLRRSKARFNQLYEKGVQEKGAGRIKELSTDAEVVSSSLVEESIWLDSFKKGYSQNMLWMLCVEIWLRQIKNGGFTA